MPVFFACQSVYTYKTSCSGNPEEKKTVHVFPRSVEKLLQKDKGIGCIGWYFYLSGV